MASNKGTTYTQYNVNLSKNVIYVNPTPGGAPQTDGSPAAFGRAPQNAGGSHQAEAQLPNAWEAVCQKHHKLILKHIKVDDIQDSVFAKEIITPREVRGLEKRKRDGTLSDIDNMNYLVVDVMYRRSEEELATFITILLEHEVGAIQEVGKVLRRSLDEYQAQYGTHTGPTTTTPQQETQRPAGGKIAM